MTSDAEVARRDLGRIISANATEIAERWHARVEADLAGKADVSATQLRDGIPDYLAEVAQLLISGSVNHLVDRGTASWARVARYHGITRVRIGFDIGQLIHEFVALRHAIRAVAAENGVAIEAADATLADLIDAAIAESVRAYVDARDHAARRVQAENIGFLTHELRNPLTAAVYAASAVRASGVPAQAGALDALDRNHRRLIELIDSVLDTERLESGKVEPRYTEVGVRDLVETATAVARKAAADKGLAFDVRCDLDEQVRIDPGLTGSAIQNLADNAVKYTDAGGVQVAVDDHGATWSVHVRDTCPGLSPEELRTIFEPFRRGATSKAGTGLGLAIARRAIEAQGGSIQAESDGPVGCHFWITLPKR